ncbi:tRNA nuclease WapA-like [Glandiceps talaboti]
MKFYIFLQCCLCLFYSYPVNAVEDYMCDKDQNPEADVEDCIVKWTDYNLVDPSFEKKIAGAWWPLPTENFEYTTEEAHEGNEAIKVTLNSDGLRGGASVMVTFPSGDEPRNVSFEGWSKAKGVDGPPDKYYSLGCNIDFLDLTTGDSSVQSEIINFTGGDQDWEHRTITSGAKDGGVITKMTCFCLFQSRTGTVYFDDFTLKTGVCEM